MTEMRAGLPVIGFADATAFEAWMAAQPGDSPGLWLKLSKKASDIASLSKSEAIDAALCQGWIDGQLDKYDESSWLIRFTPRRARSRWSEVNRTRALELMEAGRMRAAGLSRIAAAKAAAFFATLTGASRYAILYRIGAAKRPETRARKIVDFVAMLARGETLHG